MRVFVCVFVLFLFTGCAQQSVRPEHTERIFKDAELKTAEGIDFPEQELIILESRFKEYWDARKDNNWHKAFDYEDPDVIEKEKMTRGGYAGNKLGFIKEKDYEVKLIEILSTDKVRFISLHDMFIGLPMVMKDDKVRISDLWFKKNKVWYRKFVVDPFNETGEPPMIKVPAQSVPAQSVPAQSVPAQSVPSPEAPSRVNPRTESGAMEIKPAEQTPPIIPDKN